MRKINIPAVLSASFLLAVTSVSPAMADQDCDSAEQCQQICTQRASDLWQSTGQPHSCSLLLRVITIENPDAPEEDQVQEHGYECSCHSTGSPTHDAVTKPDPEIPILPVPPHFENPDDPSNPLPPDYKNCVKNNLGHAETCWKKCENDRKPGDEGTAMYATCQIRCNSQLNQFLMSCLKNRIKGLGKGKGTVTGVP